MSGFEGKNPIDIANEAERDLNSTAAKTGTPASDSTNESGVDQGVSNKFPGACVTYGSAASGAGDNRDIPLSEGGDIDPTTGKLFKARDFEGSGGPEDKARQYVEDNGGNNDIRENIR
ncbi:hypothetical protein AAFC00_000806 [Neodothiora populina]|uniref:Uncharacterized protein n=1 Tax=Neodothiora populina TaxID=2781224 RepID=A0ABR3PLT4_9PEZI